MPSGPTSVCGVFVEIESCHAGVFGDALFGGLAAGCDDGPLTGVLVMTEANPRENSLGAGYDLELQQWVGDEFSRAVLDTLEGTPRSSLLDLYQGAYLSVRGSHASLYNSAAFGDVDAVDARDFLPSAPE